MARGPRKYTTNDQNAPEVPHYLSYDIGTLTATRSWNFYAPFDGCFNEVDDIILSWGASPSADAKRVTADVQILAQTIYTTKPSVLGTANNNNSTLKAGTGVTQPVLKADLADRSFVKGDQLGFSLTESVAANDPTGVALTVGLTPFQDIDPDSTVERE